MATLSNVSVTSVKNTKAIAPGENYTVKFTLSNPSGAQGIGSVKCNLFALIGGKYYFMSKAVTQNVSISANASATCTIQMTSLKRGEACSSPAPGITGSNVFDYLSSNNLRSVTMKVMVVAYNAVFSVSMGTIESAVTGLAAMRERINSTFSSFSFVRCNTAGTKTDEGERLLSTIKISFLNNAYSEFTLTLQLYSVNGSTQTLVTTVTIPSSDTRMSQLVTGISNNTAFISTFTVAKGTNYVLKGTLSSSLESSTANCNIAKSFANMHLSAATNGGVSFGSFSSSTNSAPKFENSFPAYFYSTLSVSGALSVTGGASVGGNASVGGAATVTGALTAKGGIANIKGGYKTGITSAAGSDQTVNIPFGVTFKATPYVLISLYGSENLSKISIQITSVSTSSMNVRVINNGSASHSVGVAWMAYGTLS